MSLARSFSTISRFSSATTKGMPCGGERFADAPADAPVADQHDVAGESVEVDGHRQRGERIVGTFQGLSEFRARANPGLRRLDGLKHQRIERDRDNRSRENKTLAFRGQNAAGTDPVRPG